MSRYARKVDANHAEIVAALRACGWFVLDTSRLGDGAPDAIASRRGTVHFIEIKDGSKVPSARKLRAKQEATLAKLQAAGASVLVLTSVEEAVQV